MIDSRYRDLLEAFERRARLKQNLPDIFHGTFSQQKEFILDRSKLKALFCTRRSAKSYTAGLYLVYEALANPGCNCIFTGLTRLSAKGIIWKDILHVIDRQFGLNASFNQTDLVMRLPNGSEIWVTGIDADEAEMKKVLGRKFRLACIDEASMYTINLNGFIYGILSPAMTDPNNGGERGTICLMGTASDFPTGLFYDITTGNEKGWKLFEWTAHDNPYVAKQWQEALDDIARDRPLYMETPQFKQWYLNKWVIDEEKLVYRFSTSRNLIKDVPKLVQDGWAYVLGVDVGWEDDNAFVLTGYHINDPNLYVLKVLKKKRLTFDQVIEVISKFMDDPHCAPHKVFIDGANKQGVESMRSRSKIPFEYADKQDKATFIELCNADLVQSKIRIHDTPFNRPLWEEMSALVWVTDGDSIKFPKKEHPNLANHLCDAFLYAWRNGYHYHSAPAEKKVVVGSKDWYEQQAVNIWEKERERLVEQESAGLWPEQPELTISDLFRRN